MFQLLCSLMNTPGTEHETEIIRCNKKLKDDSSDLAKSVNSTKKKKKTQKIAESAYIVNSQKWSAAIHWGCLLLQLIENDHSAPANDIITLFMELISLMVN